MQSRLNHLESLVIGMMNNQPLKTGTSPPSSISLNKPEIPHVQDVQSADGLDLPSQSKESQPEPWDEQRTPEFGTASGQVVLGMNEVAYVGATHWAAILEDVSQLLPFNCVVFLFSQ